MQVALPCEKCKGILNIYKMWEVKIEIISPTGNDVFNRTKLFCFDCVEEIEKFMDGKHSCK